MTPVLSTISWFLTPRIMLKIITNWAKDIFTNCTVYGLKHKNNLCAGATKKFLILNIVGLLGTWLHYYMNDWLTRHSVLLTFISKYKLKVRNQIIENIYNSYLKLSVNYYFSFYNNSLLQRMFNLSQIRLFLGFSTVSVMKTTNPMKNPAAKNINIPPIFSHSSSTTDVES